MVAQIILFTQPRSGSHLLVRMISRQKGVRLLEHPYISGRWTQLRWLQTESWTDGMQPDALSAFNASMESGNGKWLSALEEVEAKGETLMIQTENFHAADPKRLVEYVKLMANEQILGSSGENFTLIPERILLQPSITPVFTIRHPVLAVPSAYRTMAKMDLASGGGRPNFTIVCCQIWNRLLYDFYTTHGVSSIIIDGDDYMTNEDFVRKLCAKMGLDPVQACLSWQQEKKEDHHPMYFASQSSLIGSSGLDPSHAAKNVDLEEEQTMWDAEFGDDARLLREIVELAMPHYRYLFDRRTRYEDL